MQTNRDRIVLPTEHAEWDVLVTDDGSRTLVHRRTGVTHHSAAGALSETKHVYLRNSGVEQKLMAGQDCDILEVGLGCGMGLLVTLGFGLPHSASIRYVALESDWPEADLIGKCDPQGWGIERQLVDRFLRWRNDLPRNPPDGCYHWSAAPESAVTVRVGDALSWQPEDDVCFDAIYCDPFAPDVTPALWSARWLEKLFEVVKPGGRLVSYCVGRPVRDALTAVGFHVKTVPGPQGGKRDVLVATRPAIGETAASDGFAS